MGRFLTLFHTGFSEIRTPDLTVGRQNADFGQGFYLSDDEEFSRRWARTRRGMETYLNRYELDTTGLLIKRFSRNEAWFDYIFSNRMGKEDALSACDVIIGPIANDTLYDTWGVLTSGLIDRKTAIALLSVGPAYAQTVLKTEKAAAALRYTGAQILPPEEIEAYREIVRREEAVFQETFARIITALPELTETKGE
ncbi:MAG: DUF3990 domain-containing protein [Clostridia bacterium]|nr:DUF3990 domain-containing protein [Clostridia bacterium]